MQILLIALLGAVGCVCRFFVSQGMYRWWGTRFPYGILTVNIIGSFLVGFLAIALIHKWQFHPMWERAMIVGFLGGFTTFSSFSYDSYQFLHQGAWLKAGIYILLSIVLCVMATFLGVLTAGALR